MNNEIKNTVTNIIYLLENNEQMAWAEQFITLNDELDSDYTFALVSLKKQFGRMGSFSDLILHKNRIPLITENDELEELKNKLYALLKLEMYK